MKTIEIGAAYIRVSTDDQTEYSPDAQLGSIKDYAKKNKILIPNENIFFDEGISGRKAEKRPAFMKMISSAKSKPRPFDVILVHKFDRFARSREDSVVYKSLLRKECGIKVVSITENMEDDKFSIILESMLEAMAEYYSINLSEEVKKGMTEKATRGEPQTIAPFGYTMKEKQFYINPDESKIIKMIFEKFVAGMGCLDLAKQLNAMGIKTHRGNLFENRTIEYILRNPVYIGKLRWNPTERTRRKYDHPDLIIADSKHEQIISPELFEKAQQKIAITKQIHQAYYKPMSAPSHWLVGLLKCGGCGGSIIKQATSFQCNNYCKGRCPTSHSLYITKAEKAVLNEIKRIIDCDSLDGVNITKATENSQDELSVLKNQLKTLNSKLDRVKQAFQNGIDTIAEYGDNKKILTSEIELVNEKISNIKKSKANNLNKKSFINILKQSYKILTFPSAPMDIKYKTSHSFIEKIVFDKANAQLIISYYI